MGELGSWIYVEVEKVCGGMECVCVDLMKGKDDV